MLLDAAVRHPSRVHTVPDVDEEAGLAHIHRLLREVPLHALARLELPLVPRSLAGVGPEARDVVVPRGVRDSRDCALLEIWPPDEAPLAEEGLADLVELDGGRNSWRLELQHEGLLLGGGAKDVHAHGIQPAGNLERLQGWEAHGVAQTCSRALGHLSGEALLPFRERWGRGDHHHPALALHDVGELVRQGGLAEERLLRLFVVVEGHHGPQGVPLELLLGEPGRVDVSALRFEQHLLIDEGDEHDALPVCPLALHVQVKIRGKVVHGPPQRRRVVQDELLVALREQLCARRGHHRQQLLEGVEGLPVVELELADPGEAVTLAGHGGVVVRVVPVPRHHATVVVLKHPRNSPNVLLRDTPHVALAVALQLHVVVPVLPGLEALFALLKKDQGAGLRGHHGGLRRIRALGGLGLVLGLVPPSSPHPRVPLLALPPPTVVHVGVHRAHLQHLLLHLGDPGQEDLKVLVHELPSLLQVAPHLWQNLLVDVQHVVQRALRDVQRRQRRQEVVSYQHADQDDVVNHPLHVKPLGVQVQLPELTLPALPEQPDVHQRETLRAGVLQKLPARPPPPPRAVRHLLPQQEEVGLVGDQGEHDEVGVQPVQAVPLVGLVLGVLFGPPEVLHDLMLALPRDQRARQHDLGLLPEGVLGDLLPDVEAQVLVQPLQELGSGGDAVGVEDIVRNLLAALPGLRLELEAGLSRLEAPGALLVDLGPRRDAIHAKEDEALWPYDRHQAVDIGEDLADHLGLAQCPRRVFVVPVRAVMYDPVHVQKKVVHGRHLGLAHVVVHHRVPLAEPPIELWDACVVWVGERGRRPSAKIKGGPGRDGQGKLSRAGGGGERGAPTLAGGAGFSDRARGITSRTLTHGCWLPLRLPGVLVPLPARALGGGASGGFGAPGFEIGGPHQPEIWLENFCWARRRWTWNLKRMKWRALPGLKTEMIAGANKQSLSLSLTRLQEE